MKSIQELKNSNSGKCLLIGSGPSVAGFDFKSLPDDMKRIAINRCFVDSRIDYQIYCDHFFKAWTVRYPIQDDRVLIGFESKTFPRMDYFFNWRDLVEGFHTGFYALQIAELIGFKKIYLVGYDYYTEKGKIHYYDGQHGTSITDAEKRMYLRVLLTDRLLRDFDRIDWNAEIYNCNPKSKLKKFQFQEDLK